MHARIGWQNLRTSEFFDSGNYYLITGTDFENGYVNLSTCHYVNKDRYDQDPNIQIDNGSILITKDGTLGKVALVQGLDKPATLNAGVFNVVIRNEEIVDNGYLYQYLKAPFLLNYVAQTATGGTIKHLNQNILVDFPVSMPSKGEQELIGDAFLRLDNLITLHQRKYDKLCAVKKSMLDKIFPKPGEVEPEIRFAGFTDPWEQRKLGEIAPVTMGQSPNGACYTDNPNDVVLVQGNADLKDGWVSPRVWTTEITKTAKSGDLIMSVRAPVGAMGKTAYDVVLGRGVAGIVGNEFLFQALSKKEAEGYWSTVSAGSTFDSINGDELRSTPIDCPRSETECEAIGNCLSKVDHLITLHQ